MQKYMQKFMWFPLVPSDAMEHSSCTSIYWHPAFPHFKFHKNAQGPTTTCWGPKDVVFSPLICHLNQWWFLPDFVHIYMPCTWEEHVIKLLFTTNVQLRYENATYIKLWKLFNNLWQLVMDCLLGKLYFAHIKLPDAAYLVMTMYNGRRLSLRFWQYNVNELLQHTQHISKHYHLRNKLYVGLTTSL